VTLLEIYKMNNCLHPESSLITLLLHIAMYVCDKAFQAKNLVAFFLFTLPIILPLNVFFYYHQNLSYAWWNLQFRPAAVRTLFLRPFSLIIHIRNDVTGWIIQIVSFFYLLYRFCACEHSQKNNFPHKRGPSLNPILFSDIIKHYYNTAVEHFLSSWGPMTCWYVLV